MFNTNREWPVLKADFANLGVMRLFISVNQLPQKPAANKIIKWLDKDPWVLQVLNRLGIEGPFDEGPLTGAIELFCDSAGFVYGMGSFSFTPKLACFLCQDPKPFPINSTFKVTWRPAYSDNPPKELALTSDQLDEYFIENGQIDLAQVLLDTINDSIPDVTKFFEEGDLNCRICGKNVATSGQWQVFGD